MSNPLKWHGGKTYLAKRIIELMPPRNTFTHFNAPYLGGGGVFFAMNLDGLSVCVNDINCDLMNFWNVLQEPKWVELFRRLLVTPFSDITYEYAKQNLPSDDVMRAWRFFARYRQSRQGLGKDYATPTTRTRRGMNENVSAWLSAVEGLPEARDHLIQAELRCMDGVDFIQKYDHERALFYCDPPYLHETRSSTGEYGEHEMTSEEHAKLLMELSSIKGKFLLSGYRSSMYDKFSNAYGWTRIDFNIDNKASSKKVKPMKTECVWVNY